MRESAQVKRGGGVYDDEIRAAALPLGVSPRKIARINSAFFAGAAAAESIEALLFQSKILRRNREGFHAAL